MYCTVADLPVHPLLPSGDAAMLNFDFEEADQHFCRAGVAEARLIDRNWGVKRIRF